MARTLSAGRGSCGLPLDLPSRTRSRFALCCSLTVRRLRLIGGPSIFLTLLRTTSLAWTLLPLTPLLVFARPSAM